MTMQTGKTTSQLHRFCIARVLIGLNVFLLLILQASPSQAAPKPCSERSNILGLSRIIEVDTSQGILLGNQQYKSVDFLDPKEVVLTFDDGPLRKNTLKVLNALEAHCTKATFFMVGRMAVADPELVKEIYRRGHTVGTHTWSHKNLKRLSHKSAVREIELGISAVSAALGRPVAPFFRFPYLADPGKVIDHVSTRNQGTFSIDGDAFDYRTKSGATMERQIMRALKRRGKGILLFHDIQTSTARGIASLLRTLRREGYKVVHLVPKGETKTLKSFDQLAAKRLKRRSAPKLSKTAIKWPLQEPPAVSVDSLKNKGPYVAKRRKPKDGDQLTTAAGKKAQAVVKKRRIGSKRKTKRRIYRKPPRRKPQTYTYDAWPFF